MSLSSASPSATISSIIKPSMDKNNAKNKQVLAEDEDDEVTMGSKISLDLSRLIEDPNQQPSLGLELGSPYFHANGFSRLSGLANSISKVYFCKYCKREFESSQALGGHQNSHKHEKKLEKREQQTDSLYDVGYPYNKFPPYIYSNRLSYSTYHPTHMGHRPLGNGVRPQMTRPCLHPWSLRGRGRCSVGVSRMPNPLSSQAPTSARFAPYYRTTRMMDGHGHVPGHLHGYAMNGGLGMQVHGAMQPRLNNNFGHFIAGPSSSTTISNTYNINLTNNINRAGFLSLNGNYVKPRTVDEKQIDPREQELDLTLKL